MYAHSACASVTLGRFLVFWWNFSVLSSFHCWILQLLLGASTHSFVSVMFSAACVCVCVRVRLCVSALCLIAWWHVVHGKIDEHQPSDPKQNDLTTTLTWLQIRLDLRPPHHSLLEITKRLWKAVRTFTGLLKTVTRHAYLRRRLRQGVGDTKVFLWSRIEFPAGAGPPVPQSIFPLFCNWWSLQPLVLLIH